VQEAAEFQVVEETLYENQRWIGGGGWSSSHLMLLDRPPWSSASGKQRSKHHAQLPEGWQWDDEDWHIDNVRLDEQGWCYGLCFGSAVGTQWVRFVSIPGNFLATAFSPFCHAGVHYAGNPEQWISHDGDDGIDAAPKHCQTVLRVWLAEKLS